MKLPVVFSLLAPVLFCVPLQAEPKANKPPKVPKPIELPANLKGGAPERRMFEFQKDDLPLVLRTLARQAGMNVVLEEGVKGEVTLRVEEKTPREVISMIAELNGLLIDEQAGVHFIKLKNPPPPGARKALTDLDEEVLEALGPTITKFLDVVIEFEAKPETAQKIARAKKALLEALIAQGFTREEAFQLVLAEQRTSLSKFKK
jgi:hypothetical protein